MVTHDSIDWYGIYQYFIEMIYSGDWPFWKPYTHAGEPFYFSYVQVQLLEPVTMVCILIGKVLKSDIMTWYHWHLFVQLLIMNIGVYCCLKQFFKHTFTNIIIYAVISFSSLPLICLRLLGIWQVFRWFPWILFFLFRIVKHGKTIDWVLCAAIIGISFHQYLVVYYVSVLFIFIFSLALNHRADLKPIIDIFRLRKLKLLMGVVLMVVILSSPFWTSLCFDINNVFPVLRFLDGSTKSFSSSLDEMVAIENYWKGASNIRDFFGLINPLFPRAIFYPWFSTIINTGRLTESVMYIGIFPLLMALYGMVFSKGKYKVNFLIMLVFTLLAMLGANYIFYRIIIYGLPYLRFARHPMHFFPFMLFCLFYFAGLGIDDVVERYRSRQPSTPHSAWSYIKLTLSLSVISLLIALLGKYSSLFAEEIVLLLFFYVVSMFFLILIRWALAMGKFGLLIISIFIAADLAVYNFINRPLMVMQRKLNFSTKAHALVFPDQRLLNLAEYSPIQRYKSMQFRKHSIDAVYNTGESAFFEIKQFHDLMGVPGQALSAIGCINSPIIKYYDKFICGREHDFYAYTDIIAEDKDKSDLIFIELNDANGTIMSRITDENVLTPGENSFAYRTITYKSSLLEIETIAQGRGFLYLSDGYDNYWKAYIDSKETALYRANHYFKSIILPAGKHMVRFVYKPMHHMLSLWFYFSTLIIIFIGTLCWGGTTIWSSTGAR